MKQGKLTDDKLRQIVFSHIHSFRSEVIVGASTGEDCAALKIDGLSVLSTDPITAASAGAGALAAHVSVNDVASAGAEPVAMLVTVLAPPSAEEEDISRAIKELADTAKSLNVEIVGGHTEVTDAVTRLVLSTVVIGSASKEKFIRTGGGKAGDALVLAGSAAKEGASIIAADMRERAEAVIGGEAAEKLANGTDLSVLAAARIASEYGAHAMHDVTEGGVLGAVWEMATASGTGASIDTRLVPIEDVIRKLADGLHINPLRLMSSGCLLVAVPDGEALAAALKEAGIVSAVIGKLTEDGIISEKGGIEPPEVDELYKLL